MIQARMIFGVMFHVVRVVCHGFQVQRRGVVVAREADMAVQVAVRVSQMRDGVVDIVTGGGVSGGGEKGRAGEDGAEHGEAGFRPKAAEPGFAGHQMLRPRLPLRQIVMLSG